MEWYPGGRDMVATTCKRNRRDIKRESGRNRKYTETMTGDKREMEENGTE